MTSRHAAPRSPRSVTTALSACALVATPVLAGLLAPAAATAGTAPTDPTDRVIALTNAQRAEAGCEPLRRSAAATAAAQRYADQMASTGRFSHTSPNGASFVDRMRAAGHARPGAENIARGQDTARRVVSEWMASPSHRENILDCSLRTLGVGYDRDGDYWVQNFGR